MAREFNHDIIQEIKHRWSPRAFSSRAVSHDDIMAILEAARYAPSCFNEQPWRFLIADTQEKLEKMRSILLPNNQVWANKAPLLILIAANKAFEANQTNNRWHAFDAGTAWGFLALEAEKRGLITHAMGGFRKNEAQEIFNIFENIELIAVVAVGYYGNVDDLDEDLQKREIPGTRKDIDELLI